MGGREEYRQKTNWEGAARWKETWVEVEADFPYPRWAWAQCQHSEWTAGVRSEVESRAVNLKSALRTIALARPLSLHFAFTDCHSFLCTELSKVWQWPSKAQRAFFFFWWRLSSDWIMVTSTQLCKHFKNHWIPTLEISDLYGVQELPWWLSL